VRVGGLLLALLVLGCGSESSVGVSTACAKDIDCPADQRCLNSTCVALGAGGCTSDAECDGGGKCLPSGACQKAECSVAADCCPSGDACGRECRDFECFGAECTDGERRECFLGCHRGERICERGEFQPCDAAPIAPNELCGNDEDDDCNGQTEEGCTTCSPDTSVPCSNACGDGESVCDPNGQAGPCSSGTDCACTAGETKDRPCGNCGTETAACESGAFAWSGECLGAGVCTSTIGAEGNVDWRACRLCGSQTRICSGDCTWGEWSECSQEGECDPSSPAEERGCTGACGVEARTCDAATCTWSDWSACNESGGCTLGDDQTQPCGNCGVKVSTCDSDCQWTAFGACSGEGVCKPETVETEKCGNCGERQRLCSSSCGWGSWSECDGEGQCTAGEEEVIGCGPSTTKGPCEQGTAVKKCSASCSWGPLGACIGAVFPKEEICGDGIDQDCSGADKTQPDDWEPNDTCGSCAWLGKDPDGAPVLYATFDEAADTVDFYCFDAVDDFNVVGFGEHIRVDLMNQSSGLDADIFLYRNVTDCKLGTSKAVAKSEQFGSVNESIDWSETTGTSDDGTWVIEVRNFEPAAAGCSKAYTLRVNGLN